MFFIPDIQYHMRSFNAEFYLSNTEAIVTNRVEKTSFQLRSRSILRDNKKAVVQFCIIFYETFI